MDRSAAADSDEQSTQTRKTQPVPFAVITTEGYIKAYKQNKKAESSGEEGSSSAETTSESSGGNRAKRKRRHTTMSSQRGTSRPGSETRESSSSSSSRPRRIVTRRRTWIDDAEERAREVLRAKEACFGCMWSQEKFGKVELEHLSLLEKFFSTQYSKMSNEALACAMAAIYKREIQGPYAARGLSLPDWPNHMILEHILFHNSGDGEVIWNEMVSTLYRTFMQLRDGFFTEERVEETSSVPVSDGHEITTTTTTQRVPNTANIRTGLQLYKCIREGLMTTSASFAPERKRTKVKNLSPSLVIADRIAFKNKGAASWL